MKRKIFLAILTVFSLALILSSVNLIGGVSASADTINLNKVVSYKYKTEYLLKDAGLTAFEGKSKIADGREVSYTLTDLADPTLADSDVTKKEQETLKATTEVEFRSIGVYTFTVKDVREGDGIVKEADVTFTVTTAEKVGEDSVSYDLTKLDEYKVSVNEALMITPKLEVGGSTEKRPIQTGDNFTVPSVESLINCSNFDFDDLTRTVYYAAPQSSSYTSTSSSTIKINSVGTYSFYVLVKDPLNNQIKTADLVIGNGGWYAKDEDGNPTGNVIVPIFTFEVSTVTEPTVVVGASEKGFLNLSYDVECFTITATGYQTKYTLYYSEVKIERGDKTDDAYNAEIAALIEVTKENGFEDKNLFNESSKSFTPVKKGYYYVQLHVVDTANVPATVTSNAIEAIDSYREVELVFNVGEFLSNNLMSVICIGVAVCCLVAIIILLCVKPKEEASLETKEEVA